MPLTPPTSPSRSLSHGWTCPAFESWSKVPGFEDVSGIGLYRTVVDVGSAWTENDGAFLELCEVNDAFVVRVNGEELPACDPLDSTADLGRRLRRGPRDIEIEVATTWLNRLRSVTAEVYGRATRRPMGTQGAVRREGIARLSARNRGRCCGRTDLISGGPQS